MKGVLFKQRLIATCLFSLHAGTTLSITSAFFLFSSPTKTWATEEISDLTNLKSEILNLKYPISISQAPVTIPVVPFELQNTPQRPQLSPQFGPYRIGPGDALTVQVQRFPDLSFAANVSPEGKIVAPLLGTLSVRGLTLEEIQEKIRLGLNRYVIDPQVIVSLAAQRPVQITITGAVARPGFYPLGFPPRLSSALLTAGGSTYQADLRQIRVRRFLLDGSFIEQKIDLFTPLALSLIHI